MTHSERVHAKERKEGRKRRRANCALECQEDESLQGFCRSSWQVYKSPVTLEGFLQGGPSGCGLHFVDKEFSVAL